MWSDLRHKKLYLLVLLIMTGVVTVAMGGGLFGQTGPWYSDWQHQAFRQLCHQLPDRSYAINGTPMAVCSRCFGIYASFAAAWLLLPLVGRWMPLLDSLTKKLLLGAVLINLIDIIGNVLGFWQNTLASRLLLGILVGMTAAVLLGREFQGNHQITKGTDYGKHRTI